MGTVTCPMLPTRINDRWTLMLPEHRHGRLEWPVWEKERLAAMHDVITAPVRVHGPNRPLVDVLAPHLVFDIGTEEGDFPALWASWGADVVLVEPNPKVWPNIRAIFQANDFEAHVLGAFVGFAGTEPRQGSWGHEAVQPGQAFSTADVKPDVREADGWPHCAHGEIIGDHGFLALPERPDVPVTTVDLLAEQCGDPTVITIDVEGAELVVLRGAERVLTEAKPAVFLSVHLDEFWVEWHYEGDTPETIQTFMKSYGYEGRWLATDHEEHWEWRHPEGR